MLDDLLDFMEDKEYNVYYRSCDEVAEELLDKWGDGYVLTFYADDHIPGNCMTGTQFETPTDRENTWFNYHTVLCMGRGWVLDPLLLERYGGVIEYEHYFNLLHQLNPNINFKYYDGVPNY